MLVSCTVHLYFECNQKVSFDFSTSMRPRFYYICPALCIVCMAWHACMQCLRVVCPFQFHRPSRKCLDVNNNSSRKYFDVLNISSEIKTKIKHQTTQSLEPCLRCTKCGAQVRHPCTLTFHAIDITPGLWMGKVFRRSPETTDTVHSVNEWVGLKWRKKIHSQHTVKRANQTDREWMQKYDWMAREKETARDKKATRTHIHSLTRTKWNA